MAMFPTAAELENVLDEARAKNWDRLLTVREEVSESTRTGACREDDLIRPGSARDLVAPRAN